jgi:hypothetical protein
VNVKIARRGRYASRVDDYALAVAEDDFIPAEDAHANDEVVAHVYDFRWDGFQVSELRESTADWRFNHRPVGKNQVLSGA